MLLKKCWVSGSEDPAKHLAASDNDLSIYLVKTGGKVAALDRLSGKQIWESDFGGEGGSNLLADQNSLFFLTNSSQILPGKAPFSSLRSISKQTGIAGWNATLPFSEITYLGESGNAILAIGADGFVSSINKASGNILWQTQLNKKLTVVPWFTAAAIVLSLEPGEIEIISPSDGRVIFQLQTDSIPTSVYLSDERTLIWGDKRGNVAAVDIITKQIGWKFRNGAQVSGVTAAGKDILVTSYDNFVYLMSPTSGKIAWKRRLSGRVAEKPAVGAKFAAITVIGEPGVSFVDLETGKVLNRILLDDDDYVIGTPLVMAGSVFFSKADGVYLYSAGDCGVK
jgi:outer membrane protein assembly factor BamB